MRAGRRNTLALVSRGTQLAPYQVGIGAYAPPMAEDAAPEPVAGGLTLRLALLVRNAEMARDFAIATTLGQILSDHRRRNGAAPPPWNGKERRRGPRASRASVR